MKIRRHVLAALVIAFASDVLAQATPSSRAAGAWTCPCPGRQVPLGSAPNCSVACFGGGSGVGSPSSLQQQQMDLATQAGGLLGQMLQDALFGNPQKEAQRRAEQEAWQAQLQRMAAEEEARKEAMKERILAMLKGVGPAPALALKGVESRPGLQLKLGDSAAPRGASLADIPPTSAMAQLTRAAYYSDQAAQAKSDEDALALADAAFNATIGAPVDLPVPPATPALAVQDADMPKIESVRNQYRAASDRAQQSLAKVAETEQQRELAERVAKETRARLAEAERAEASANAVDRAARQAELAKAREIATEAKRLVDKLNKQLADAQAAAEATQAGVNASAGATLDLLGFLRNRNGIGLPPGNQPEKDAYVRGMLEGAMCQQKSPGSYCGSLQGQVRTQCEANYTNGFKVGERTKENNLFGAYNAGKDAKRDSLPLLVGFNHPKSGGPCRERWVNAFSSGYHGTLFTMIGR